MLGALPCGCGQCLPCRINRRRLWSHRMVLESAKSVSSAFVTLTYSPMSVPTGLSLNPRDPQLWMKRLRKSVWPNRLRYFLVGEYGNPPFQRPHYHAAVFGLDPIVGGGDDRIGGLVHDTWCRSGCGTSKKKLDERCRGFTYTGDLSSSSASYICGYVTKKMTSKDDPRLEGRYPEFARMSLKPGIGASAMTDVAGALEDYVAPEMFSSGNFPSILTHGSKSMPLGRYLRSVLRRELGYGRDVTDDEKKAFLQKMRLMFEDEALVAKKEKRAIANWYVNKQKIASLCARFKIYSKEGKI